MGKAEGQIARLEALAAAAPQDVEIDVIGYRSAHGSGQRLMALAIAIVQQLNGQPVARPVHARRGGGDAHRQRSFIADRKLYQHMRQLSLVQFGALQLGAFAKSTHPGQPRQLDRKGADGNQDDAEGKLKELGKTVHGDRSSPHKARFCGR